MQKKNSSQELDFFYLGQDPEKEKEKQKQRRKKEMGKKTKEVRTRGASRTRIKNKEKEKPIQQQDIFQFDDEIIIGVPKTREKGKEKKKKKGRQNIKKHTTPPKEKKPLTKKQQKALQKKQKILTVVKWLVLIGLLIGAIIYFLLSPLFNITQIEVQGNEKLSTEQIISLSQIPLGENTFKMNKLATIEKVKQNPYVESVRIKRKLPSLVSIEVKERKATFMLQYVNSYVYLNNQGYLLEITEEKKELPILTGIVTPEEEIKPGNRLWVEDLEKLETVLAIREVANSNELSSLITKIDISDKQNYKLILEEEKKTVQLGNGSDLTPKMLYLKAILEKTKGKEGEIILNINEDKIIFREKV